MKRVALGIFGLAVLATAAAGIAGYALNVVHFAQQINSTVDAKEICRGVGVVIPIIGAILGWVI
jgi:hypothetical protein